MVQWRVRDATGDERGGDRGGDAETPVRGDVAARVQGGPDRGVRVIDSWTRWCG